MPEAPKGVRVRLGDRWISMEPRYRGVDEAGLHAWCVVLVCPPDLAAEGPLIDELAADVLPAKTTLSVEVQWPES